VHFQNPPASLDRVVLTVIWRIVGQNDLQTSACGKLDHSFYELGTIARNIRPIVQIDHHLTDMAVAPLVSIQPNECNEQQNAADGRGNAMARDEYRSFFAEFDWPWYMPSVDEYEALAKSSGLHDARLWDELADRYFQDAETMIKWVDQPTLVPFFPPIPDPVKSSFRDFVVNSMLEETKQADGRCFETFRRINVSATK